MPGADRRHPPPRAPCSRPMIDRLAVPLPWLDRAGRPSWLKLAVFLACIAPALYLAAAYRLDALGAKPITALIHATGDWAVRFLLLSLAIAPLRRIADWPKVMVCLLYTSPSPRDRG